MNLRRIISIAAIAMLTGCEQDKPLAPGPQPPATSEEFVQVLATVYRTQDYATFSVLLADDFLFILNEPNPDTGETRWDAATVEAIVILVPESEFTERPDLYTTSDPPGPLDPTRWTASGAVYGADAFFQLQGDIDFRLTGRAYFLVVEDRTKPLHDPGRLQLYRWEDLGWYAGDLDAVAPSSWSQFKGLYR